MTARVRKGLPFVCRITVEKIIIGIIARGQSLYPVKICAYVFMGNHYHMILTGQSCHISPFMNYIQGNIAQSLQRFIPDYYEGFVWESRFKEQILITPEDVINKMAYIYLNPVRARLVEKASEYPGISSYHHFINNKESFLTKWIPVSAIRALPEHYKKKQDYQILKSLLKDCSYEELTIVPFAWFQSFKNKLSKEDIKKKLIAHVAQEELKYKTRGLGVNALRHQRLRNLINQKKKPALLTLSAMIRNLEFLKLIHTAVSAPYAKQPGKASKKD